MNRLEKFKRSFYVVNILYRKEIRKKLLKILVILNGVLLFTSIMNNMASMVLYTLNMFYLYKYLQSEYPEESLHIKDRYQGIIE